MKTCYELQTIAVSYKEICAGESPWIPLGMFSHDFFGNFVEQRTALVQDPIEVPPDATLDQLRWAVFCAASVEYLCLKYAVPCPEWVHHPSLTLAEPWYYSLGAHKPHIRERLERETPEAFTKRNIFCGERVWANKYEVATTTTTLHERRSA